MCRMSVLRVSGVNKLGAKWHFSYRRRKYSIFQMSFDCAVDINKNSSWVDQMKRRRALSIQPLNYIRRHRRLRRRARALLAFVYILTIHGPVTAPNVATMRSHWHIEYITIYCIPKIVLKYKFAPSNLISVRCRCVGTCVRKHERVSHPSCDSEILREGSLRSALHVYACICI